MLKKFLTGLIRNLFFSSIIKNLNSKIGVYLYFRAKFENEIELKILKNFLSKEVSEGPFKGLKYSSFEIGKHSTLLPKLFGTYENEITNELQSLIARNEYSEFVNIGCAEGYYAIGISKLIPNVKTFAFDSDLEMQSLTRAMAACNNIINIEVGGEVDEGIFEKIFVRKKALLLCDCEGYEQYLFNIDNIRYLKNYDVLIEVHEFLKKGILNNLKKVFSTTHDIKLIKSVNDFKKIKKYKSLNPLLQYLNKNEMFQAVAENRSQKMEWLIARSKND